MFLFQKNYAIFIVIALMTIAINSAIGQATKSTEQKPSHKFSTSPVTLWPESKIADNPLLQKSISIQRDRTHLKSLLESLQEFTKVKLRAGTKSLMLDDLALGIDNAKLWVVLDVIAVALGAEWRDNPKGGMELKSRWIPSQNDMFRPKSDEAAEIFQRGRQLLDQLNTLADGTDTEWFHDNTKDQEQPKSVPLNSLPSEIQSNIRRMYELNDKNPEIPESSKTNSRLRDDSGINLQLTGDDEGLANYTVTVEAGIPGVSGASRGISFNIFHDPRDGYAIVPYSDVAGIDVYQKAYLAMLQEKAISSDAKLLKMTEIKCEDDTFVGALENLRKSSRVNYCFTVDSTTLAKHSTFRTGQVTVKKALDQICSRFDFKVYSQAYEPIWSETAKGIVFGYWLKKE